MSWEDNDSIDPTDPPFDTEYTLGIDINRGDVSVGCYLPSWALEPILDYGRDHPDEECSGIQWNLSLDRAIDELLDCYVTQDNRSITGHDELDDVLLLANKFERIAQKLRSHVNGMPIPIVKAQ